MGDATCVTVWNEFRHEKTTEQIADIHFGNVKPLEEIPQT